MKIDKNQIMHKLYERDYIDKMHRVIKEGLIGSLHNEYILQKPLREPYEKYNAEVDQFVSLPIFHAMVDMMVANLLNFVSENLVYEVLNAIEAVEQIKQDQGEVK